MNGNKQLKKIIFEQENLIHITSITVYEIGIGLERTRRKISEQRYKELYKSWMEFISGMEVFPLSFKEAEKAAEIYEILESKGQLIDDNDILIIGVMLSNGINQIITKNVQHFKKIEEIKVINY